MSKWKTNQYFKSLFSVAWIKEIIVPISENYLEEAQKVLYVKNTVKPPVSGHPWDQA